MEVAHGRTIEEAIDDLEWDDGEIMIVGSSRLAEKNKLFIGSTANKVLRRPAGSDGGGPARLPADPYQPRGLTSPGAPAVRAGPGPETEARDVRLRGLRGCHGLG